MKKFTNNITGMQQALQFTPYTRKEGDKVKILQLTDLTLHTSNKRHTTSPGKKVERSFAKNAPERLYGSLETQKNTNSDSSRMEIRSNIIEYIMQDPSILEYIKNEEAQGYTIVIEVPKEGLPIYLGKDAQEFIKSKKGKRILRRLDKNKNRDKM
jgi:hypothetical protein